MQLLPRAFAPLAAISILFIACSGPSMTTDTGTLQDAARDAGPMITDAADAALRDTLSSDAPMPQDVRGGDVVSDDPRNTDVPAEATVTDAAINDVASADVAMDTVSRDVAVADVVTRDVRTDVPVASDANVCAAQDARGVGGCARVLGVFWDGSACRFVSGCSCSGADCGSSYPDLPECEAAYASCSTSDDCRTRGCPPRETCQPCRGPGGGVYVCLPDGTIC